MNDKGRYRAARAAKKGKQHLKGANKRTAKSTKGQKGLYNEGGRKCAKLERSNFI